MLSDTLADHIQLWGFHDGYTLFTDGSAGFGLEIEPKDVGALRDGDIDQFATDLRKFLNSLPDQLEIQWVQDIKAGNSGTLETFHEISQKNSDPLAKSLSTARFESLKKLNQEGQIPDHRLRVFVRRKFSQKVLKIGYFTNSQKAQQVTTEFLGTELKVLARIKSDLEMNIENLGLKTELLKPNDIVNMVYEQWNPSREVAPMISGLEDVRDDIVFTDAFIAENGFDLGETHHRVISLKNLPDQTFSAMASALRQLPFDSRLFLNVRVPDHEKEIENLKSQRRVAFSMANGGSQITDIESQSKFDEIEALLSEMVNDGEKVFYMSMNILLRSKDLDSLENQVSETLSLVRELSGSEAMLETIPSFDIFKEFSIPNARGKERERRVKSSNLADLLPIYAPWRGHLRPSLVLRSSQGSLLTVDPFDESHKNANQLISAGSGAGKSFFCNLALLQMLKDNPKVFLVDIGGSYKKICDNLGGQYIPLGMDSSISINPFDLPPTDLSPSKEKIKFMVGLIEIMTKEDEASGLPKLTRSMLEESIIGVYNEVVKPRLSDLQRKLFASESNELNNIGKILGSWCGDTPYGQFIDRQTNVSMDKDIVSFDLKGLESSADLQTVCLYLITDLIWSTAQQDRFRMKIVVFDECWKLLKDKSGQDFIESVFRTCRKYYTSCIAISQAIQDFSKSAIASAIMPNCELKWLLQQGQADSTCIEEHLGLNSNEVELVSELRQKQGFFSETFLMSGPKNRAVIRIEPTPLELWIATTNPKDLSLIEKTHAEQKNLSSIEVLEHLAKEYPHGA